jgi:hypothetical protein
MRVSADWSTPTEAARSAKEMSPSRGTLCARRRREIRVSGRRELCWVCVRLVGKRGRRGAHGVVEEEVARALEEVVEFLGCLEDGGAGLFEMWGELEV